ncbi:MAG TPA: nucleotidyl transferase AbiEii/AbiGii toxin family protein [Polyangiaceae bacterium]|jgi:hypothetical protein
MTEPDALVALKQIAGDLSALGKPFCVVGGLGVSVRGEVRFTRDVDVAVHVDGDAEVESLVRDLRSRRYDVVALVEHDETARLATVRLRSPSGVTVDLLTASSGIEPEIVARATAVEIPGVGSVPVAQAEELLAMKVLSMEERRPQDRIDATKLLELNVTMDLEQVRADLRLIESRGFHRKQDLSGKLEGLLLAR